MAVTLAQFQRSVSDLKAPSGMLPALTALWWAAKDDWDGAHKIVMDGPGRDCAWVHAYLHRAEGDLGNSAYWYKQAGRPTASGPLDVEWRAIAAELLAAASAHEP